MFGLRVVSTCVVGVGFVVRMLMQTLDVCSRQQVGARKKKKKKFKGQRQVRGESW